MKCQREKPSNTVLVCRHAADVLSLHSRGNMTPSLSLRSEAVNIGVESSHGIYAFG